MAHAGLALEFTCALKCLGHWLATGAPLALLAPVAAIALGASPTLAPLLFACALAGGLAFAFTGGIGAALSLGARRGGLLTAVIVLPLFVPPVIFGGGALDAFTAGLPWRAGFALLGAYAAAAVALGPLAMAAACRNALS
jgi:heme exporter protein B